MKCSFPEVEGGACGADAGIAAVERGVTAGSAARSLPFIWVVSPALHSHHIRAGFIRTHAELWLSKADAIEEKRAGPQ